MNDDPYAELKALALEARLDVAMWWYENTSYPEQRFLVRRMLLLGFLIAQPDGWEYIAPAWLREWKEANHERL
jgi:hypothetical protein